MIKKTIAVIVENEHGVLARIVNLFAARGYNIESLTVSPIPNSKYSRMTIATHGNAIVLEQIIKQLYKLIPVYKVLESEHFIEKEMALVKFPISNSLADIDALAKSYNGAISNVNSHDVIVTVVDSPKRIDHFISAISNFKPKEIVRSGVCAIENKL